MKKKLIYNLPYNFRNIVILNKKKYSTVFYLFSYIISLSESRTIYICRINQIETKYFSIIPIYYKQKKSDILVVQHEDE